MKVLVTGGTGYLGRNLIGYVRRDGHDVRLLVRQGSEHKVASPDSYEIITGDIFNTNACLRASDGCDAVIHLVGIIREFPSRGITFDQYHRVATHNIVDAARRNGVGRFIHMSALGTNENARAVYHQTKLAGERVVQESPLRWTIFRPSWIFGPGDQLVKQITQLIRGRVVPMIDGGRSVFQPIAVENVCECMSRALVMPETQHAAYDLGGPDRMAFKEIVQAVATEMGVGVRSMSVPGWAIKPVVGVLQRFAWFPLTIDQMRMMAEDNVCEVDRFVRTFQVDPQKFAKALPTLLAGTSFPEKTPVLL